MRNLREAVAPVRPAYRRRNVEHPRTQRIAHERRLAQSRRFQSRRILRGSRFPGKRKSPREGICREGHGQGRFGKARYGKRQNERVHERQDRREVHRRPRQARQYCGEIKPAVILERP